MAKQRKGISKALRQGNVESAYQMPEGDVDESGFESPKTNVEPNGLFTGKEGAAISAITNPVSKVLGQIENSNPVASVSNSVTKEAVDNAESISDLTKVPTLVNQINKETQSVKDQLDDQTLNTLSAYSLSEDPTDDAAWGQPKDAVGQVNPMEQVNAYTFPEGEVDDSAYGQPKDQIQATEEIVPGSGQVISRIVSDESLQGQRPAYTQLATKNDVTNQLAQIYSAMSQDIPGAVVEKLGIQDYYPSAARDIAVGTFSGSRIGSQTIYSGTGGLLPMGLYDARKRAISEAAKSKQAELDKILSVPETTPQLMAAFNEYAVNTLYEDLARTGFNPSAYNKDLQSQRNKYRLQAVAKNMTYLTTRSKDLLAATIGKDGKPGAYMPEDMKQELTDFLTGSIENPEEYFSGKKNLSDITNRVKSYSDASVWIDGMRPNWVAHPTEVPVNIKTGKELTEENVAELNAAADGYLKAVEDGSRDTESYMTVIKKYIDVDPSIVDDWMDGQGYSKDDPIRQTMRDYFEKSIPAASFTSSIKTVANQNVARARLQLDRDKFNYQKESDKESFWGTINANLNDAVNTRTGKTFNQELAALQASGLKGEDLDNAIKNVWNNYSFAAGTKLVKNKNGSYVVQMPSTETQSKSITSKDIYVNGKPVRVMAVQYYDKDKEQWIDANLTPQQIANSKKNIRVAESKQMFTDEQKAALGKSGSSIYTKVVGHQIQKGFYNDQGQFEPLTANNLARYNRSNRKATLQRTVEQPYSRGEQYDKTGAKVNYVETILPGQVVGAWSRIDDPAGQQLLDEQAGYTTKQSAEAQGAPDSSSGSGESGGVVIAQQ
jgi:hypothetical protein